MNLRKKWVKKIIIYKKRVNFIDRREKLFLKNWKEEKDNFQKILLERIEFFNQFYNFEYNQIKIKDQKTRWGSCSVKKNLNFNYRIFLLPDDLRDYIIIHELCHLEEMNHSKKFWNLVQKKAPDYKRYRKGLRKFKF